MAKPAHTVTRLEVHLASHLGHDGLRHYSDAWAPAATVLENLMILPFVFTPPGVSPFLHSRAPRHELPCVLIPSPLVHARKGISLKGPKSAPRDSSRLNSLCISLKLVFYSLSSFGLSFFASYILSQSCWPAFRLKILLQHAYLECLGLWPSSTCPNH